jgi:poly(3-hydroxybutyrate) depolymerase
MPPLSRRMLVAALLATVAATSASAQALTGILSLGVLYNTLKNTTHPEGELKAQIDSIDVQLAAAGKLGRTSEQRRLYAKGMALLNHRPWTPEAEFASSLVLRTEHQVVDPSQRWSVRVEMGFAPTIELTRPLNAHAQLRQRTAGAPASAPLAVVKELGSFDGVPRDLRDTPLVIEADLREIADGSYVMAVELLDSARTLGTAFLPIVVRSGLDASIARLEAAAAKTPEPVRSDLRFPADRLRHVNLSRLTLSTFNAARDFAAAESLLVAVNSGKDPWAGRTGDLKRHYTLTAADEVMPYRLYVPRSYTPAKAMPLVISLHGLGGTEDAFFEAYGRKMPELAELRGYIVAAPLGYRVDGAYGVSLGANPADAAAKRTREFSEQDVMQVVDAVRQQYTIDPRRIYLMGHSMGAIGTWALAAKYPDRWTALGVFSGFGAVNTARIISAIPQFVVHGDADPTVPVGGSRTMVAALKGVGADVTYIEVPGGNHVNVVEPNLPGMFDFFDRHAARPAAKP